MILQDHDCFASVADSDAGTGQLVWRHRGPEERFEISGWAGRVGAEEIVVYKRDAQLFVGVSGRELRLDDIVVELSNSAEHRRWRVIYADGAAALDVTYVRPAIHPPRHDVLSPGEDEETYDFGLMLYDVARNPERKAVCLETWV